MRFFLPILLLISAGLALAKPVITDVHGLGSQPAVAPGGLALLDGVDVATELNRAEVFINGVAALAIPDDESTTQVLFQIPAEIPVGEATLTVTVDGVESDPFTFTVSPVAPAIAVQADVYHLDQTPVRADNAANPGESILVTGITGAGLSPSPVVTATVGGVPAPVNSFLDNTWPFNIPGVYTIEVVVPAAAGPGVQDFGLTVSGVTIVEARFVIVAGGGDLGTPEITAVVQAFDGAAHLSPGTFIEIYGLDLSETERQWGAGNFTPDAGPGGLAPTSLDGVEVLVNNKNAYVAYISSGQVNALVNEDDAEGPVSVEVRNANGRSNIFIVDMSLASPALHEHPLWTDGSNNFAVAYTPDFSAYANPEDLLPPGSLDRPMRPARPDDFVTIFVVGCGATNPRLSPGRVPTELTRIASPIEMRINNVLVEELDGFRAPGLSGLFQFNFKVPNLPPGIYTIELWVDGTPTGQGLSFAVGQ